MPSWAAASHWRHEILTGPRWQGKGKALKSPFIQRRPSLSEGSPRDMGRRDRGWWEGHSAPATNAVKQHVFIGPADKSNETSSCASRGLFHPRGTVGSMAPVPLTPNPALCALWDILRVTNHRGHNTNIPGQGTATVGCSQGHGKGALGVPWPAWLQPRWSNPERSGAHTQLY